MGTEVGRKEEEGRRGEGWRWGMGGGEGWGAPAEERFFALMAPVRALGSDDKYRG